MRTRKIPLTIVIIENWEEHNACTFLPLYLKNYASEFYCEMPNFQTELRVFLNSVRVRNTRHENFFDRLKAQSDGKSVIFSLFERFDLNKL